MKLNESAYQTDLNTPITVLLVDDESVFRNNVAKLLTKRGFTVDQAESGLECLDFIKRKPVEVIVLDVKMPGISGIETLRKIKKMHLKAEVILLTGQASAKDGVEGIKTGAFDYLSKPVEIDHLVGKISQARNKVRLEEEHKRETEFRAGIEKQMVATERLASLGTLATGVAHEINNPLAIIKQSAKLMRLLEEVVLTVWDNGEGIPKENLEKIYEPFFSTKSPGDGTGLGLYVTRGIIDGLNGAIFVESQMGQGACFTVKLPRYWTDNNRS